MTKRRQQNETLIVCITNTYSMERSKTKDATETQNELAALAIWNDSRDQLMRFVLRHTRDKSLAEDIVHDVFLKVHDKLPQLRAHDKMQGWIFGIAKNTVIDHFRRTAKTIRAVDLDWDSDGVTLNDCVSACLREMMTTLPNKYRQALELAELKDMSQLELSKKLNISYSGAKSRVQRARQMLRERMDETYHIQFDHYGNAVTCLSRLPCGCN